MGMLAAGRKKVCQSAPSTKLKDQYQVRMWSCPKTNYYRKESCAPFDRKSPSFFDKRALFRKGCSQPGTTKNCCCGQLWVWHMYYGVGLWWVVPPNKINVSHWNTVWVSIDRLDLCQTHCKQVPDLPAGQYGLCFVLQSAQCGTIYLSLGDCNTLAIVFQVCSLYIPTLMVHLSGPVSGSP